ncbi:MAG: 16S rRNA (uracil(1498)-N(3))-methyltransferase [Ktedonobacteraceae bacterium]
MHRFFVHDTGLALQHTSPDSVLTLPEKIAHQVRDVLHLHSGEQLVLLDNSGEEFVTEIMRTERKIVEVRVIERRAGRSESPVRIVLCQGLLKSARFELILEKGTELGVSVFAPILCRRSTAGLEDAGPAKIQRWQRIIQEATEQCGRSRLPQLLPIRSLKQALDEIPHEALALIPWEEEQNQSLRDALQAWKQQGKTVVLFIGPEGGLMAEEVMLAQHHGVQSVTLGQRIVRAETAALATVANVMYELED